MEDDVELPCMKFMKTHAFRKSDTYRKHGKGEMNTVQHQEYAVKLVSEQNDTSAGPYHENRKTLTHNRLCLVQS